MPCHIARATWTDVRPPQVLYIQMHCISMQYEENYNRIERDKMKDEKRIGFDWITYKTTN